jgi:hypothetical protein
MYLTVAGAGGGVAPGRLVPAELSIALRGRGVRQAGRHREQEVVRECLVRLRGREKDAILKDRVKKNTMCKDIGNRKSFEMSRPAAGTRKDAVLKDRVNTRGAGT